MILSQLLAKAQQAVFFFPSSKTCSEWRWLVGYLLYTSIKAVTISKVSLFVYFFIIIIFYETTGHKNAKVSTLGLPHGLSILDG